MLRDIQDDSAAVPLEHHRAVPALRDCPRRGFRISKGFISPLDLCAIGLLPGRCCGRVRGCVG
jgi:hypothetical protein